MASKRHLRKKQQRERDAREAAGPVTPPAPPPVVNLSTVLAAPAPVRQIGAPIAGDDFDFMTAAEIRLAALNFLQTRGAVPVHPAAPVLTPDEFDRLLAVKQQTGLSHAFTIYPVMQAYIDVTAANGYNRPIVGSKADIYTHAMQLSNWRLDGNPTQFDWNGNRINGQHRGLGCRRSGKPYAVYMSFGHDPEDYKTMDQGAVRRARDLFDQAGWSYPGLVAGMLTWLTRCLDNKFDSRSTPVPEDLLKRGVALGKDSIIDAVKVGRRISLNLNSTIPAQYIAAVYWLARQVSPGEADHFFERWVMGGTSEYPVQVAVSQYISARHKDHAKAVLDTIQMAVLINMWNYFAVVGVGRPGMSTTSADFVKRFNYVPNTEGVTKPAVVKYSRSSVVRPSALFRKRRAKV